MGLIALLFGIGGGLLTWETERFERDAAREIGTRLQGDAAQVEVTIEPSFEWQRVHSATIFARDFSIDGLPLFTEPDRSQAGKLDRLNISLQNFRLKGLLVQELKAEIPDCRYDHALALSERQLRLSRSGVGKGEVAIAQEALADWIVAKYAEIKTATVKVFDDVIWVEGYGEFLIVKTNFRVIANVESTDGTTLALTDARIWFDGRRADGLAAETLLKTLNPIVDLDEDLGLYDAVKVEWIRLRDGVLRAGGDTKIPVRPADDMKDGLSGALSAGGGISRRTDRISH